MKPKPSSRVRQASYRRHLWVSRLVFLLPGLVYFSVFHFYPVGASFYLSLYDWSVLTAKAGRPFVGMDNYVNIFRDPVFVKATLNTIYFTVWTVAGTVFLGLVLATLFS